MKSKAKTYTRNDVNVYKDSGSWGQFEQYCHKEPCTVKLINIKAGKELSLQYHENRSEFWKIISGDPILVIGDMIIEGQKDDEFFIPTLTEHQIITQGKPATILEIAYGVFEEADTERSIKESTSV
ncbi:hypothetical protein JKA74_05390 [Marivirga sp. S37H4]|uniref:Mannose-6-phosphate isomerase type II C-terminal domain-containing protein n=1 Tax=Marivirga aurantiaca TaxID=2802615 RepID=A0A935C9V2_9BACT|nr:hypothetical protein [Marivirga aurantiaca]MBK6264463.1 hypothetical protein [Marivirga aurantiaca]